MIYERREFWVADDKTPKMEDITAAIEMANTYDCVISLNWKGPGYKWYGDTYHREIRKDSNAEEIFANLPKIYGI